VLDKQMFDSAVDEAIKSGSKEWRRGVLYIVGEGRMGKTGMCLFIIMLDLSVCCALIMT
jgi:hypothetical protein